MDVQMVVWWVDSLVVEMVCYSVVPTAGSTEQRSVEQLAWKLVAWMVANSGDCWAASWVDQRACLKAALWAGR